MKTKARLDRPYHQVTFAMAHDAHTATHDYYDSESVLTSVDQTRVVRTMLKDGIRTLRISSTPGSEKAFYYIVASYDPGSDSFDDKKTEIEPGEFLLSHGPHWLNDVPGGRTIFWKMSDFIQLILDFLNAPENSSEIVTLFDEGEVSDEDLGGFYHRLMGGDAHQPGGSTKCAVKVFRPDKKPFDWPTLQEMITANTRLVLFVTGDKGSPPSAAGTKGATPFLLRAWKGKDKDGYVAQSPYEYVGDPNEVRFLPTDKTKSDSSGDGDLNGVLHEQTLYLFNHFFYDYLETNKDILQASRDFNDWSVGDLLAVDTARAWAATRRRPNFINVDFYQGAYIHWKKPESRLFETVARLNEVDSPDELEFLLSPRWAPNHLLALMDDGTVALVPRASGRKEQHTRWHLCLADTSGRQVILWARKRSAPRSGGARFYLRLDESEHGKPTSAQLPDELSGVGQEGTLGVLYSDDASKRGFFVTRSGTAKPVHLSVAVGSGGPVPTTGSAGGTEALWHFRLVTEKSVDEQVHGWEDQPIEGIDSPRIHPRRAPHVATYNDAVHLFYPGFNETRITHAWLPFTHGSDGWSRGEWKQHGDGKVQKDGKDVEANSGITSAVVADMLFIFYLKDFDVRYSVLKGSSWIVVDAELKLGGGDLARSMNPVAPVAMGDTLHVFFSGKNEGRIMHARTPVRWNGSALELAWSAPYAVVVASSGTTLTTCGWDNYNLPKDELEDVFIGAAVMDRELVLVYRADGSPDLRVARHRVLSGGDSDAFWKDDWSGGDPFKRAVPGFLPRSQFGATLVQSGTELWMLYSANLRDSENAPKYDGELRCATFDGERWTGDQPLFWNEKDRRAHGGMSACVTPAGTLFAAYAPRADSDWHLQTLERVLLTPRKR